MLLPFICENLRNLRIKNLFCILNCKEIKSTSLTRQLRPNTASQLSVLSLAKLFVFPPQRARCFCVWLRSRNSEPIMQRVIAPLHPGSTIFLPPTGTTMNRPSQEIDTTDRRDFLKVAGATLAAASAFPLVANAAEGAPDKKYKKAVKWGMVQGDGSVKDKFKMLKDVGFDGVDLDSPSNLDRDEVLRARDETGLTVHGVVDSVHWKDTLSHPDPAVRARGLEGLKTALRDSKYYGGTTVLLVPAVVNKEVSYADAYTRSQAEIKKALPLAEELGIKIGLENVWNNFLVRPLETARYIDELNSPLVGA